MRTIGVVTVARSDYGIYLPILREIEANPELELHLMVSGTHLSPEFGMTVKTIEADGFHVDERIEMLLSSDSPEGVAKAMGLGTVGFAQSFARFQPDILLVLGDRFEMHAAVSAALPFNMPVAHIHGGESTEGAIDERIRHSITKMSHLHFVSTDTYGQRVVQMGEEPWRVIVSGAPALDNLPRVSLLGRQELKKTYCLDLAGPTLLVTFHPLTLRGQETEHCLQELLAAVEEAGLSTVFTYPNADPQGRLIIETIQEFAGRHPRSRIAANLGTQAYFSLMSHAAAMVGNSSSGIIEAASFKLPVVNIGSRQQGRIRPRNVIDVDSTRDDILAGIREAVDPDFKLGLEGLVNPYGDGHAAQRIVESLQSVSIGDALLMKRFHRAGETAPLRSN